MTRKYLIMAVTSSGKKVLDVFNVESMARKMLPNYKRDDINSLYIKQVKSYGA